MKEALENAGFGAVSLYGGLDGRKYDEKALTLVAVARK